jgi:hypothetical protein
MALVPSNINEMIQAIRRSGVAYSNRYELMFGIPSVFPSGNPAELKNLTVRCDAVTVPGRGFSTTPYRFYGPARNMPYEPIYSGEINISVILSADLRERKFFEDWMNFVCSRDNFKFGYYDDYITDLEITVFGKDEAPTHKFFVEEVYPKIIGDLSFANDRENEYLTQEITFGFRRYTSAFYVRQFPEYNGGEFPPPSVPKNNGNGLGIAALFQGIGEGASNVMNGIGSIFSPKKA